MSKRINAKGKIERRLGETLWGRAKSPVLKREYGLSERQRSRAFLGNQAKNKFPVFEYSTRSLR